MGKDEDGDGDEMEMEMRWRWVMCWERRLPLYYIYDLHGIRTPDRQKRGRRGIATERLACWPPVVQPPHTTPAGCVTVTTDHVATSETASSRGVLAAVESGRHTMPSKQPETQAKGPGGQQKGG